MQIEFFAIRLSEICIDERIPANIVSNANIIDTDINDNRVQAAQPWLVRCRQVLNYAANSQLPDQMNHV